MGIITDLRRILGRKHGREYADPHEEMARVEAARETFGLYDGPSRSEHLIVSLTSFPARFDKLHFVIGSILCQTMRPDEIILYLDDEISVTSLPGTLLDMQRYGLQIEKRPLDLRPHKKYYYVMMEHPDATVITVDDDLIYPAGIVEGLLGMHEKHPDTIVAGRAHRIRFDESGEMLSYRQWGWEDGTVGVPSLTLCATGTGGGIVSTAPYARRPA